MNKAISKKLIPVWVDHNNKFHIIKGYFVHEDTGDIYSTKQGKLKKLKPCTNRGRDKGKKSYPFVTLIDPIFGDLYLLQKTVMLHRILKTSYIFHYNFLLEELKKAFKHIPEKDLEALDTLPRLIQEELYRGLIINHIDHDKSNHKMNNLELVSAQENTKAYKKHVNKEAYISLTKQMYYKKYYGRTASC
jgi:hypothetical protein